VPDELTENLFPYLKHPHSKPPVAHKISAAARIVLHLAISRLTTAWSRFVGHELAAAMAAGFATADAPVAHWFCMRRVKVPAAALRAADAALVAS